MSSSGSSTSTSSMQTEIQWNSKMSFTGRVGSHSFVMDAKAPLGEDLGPTPKELLLFSMSGCTAMDVVALMKKYRQEMTGLSVRADAEKRSEHPQIFVTCTLHFFATGSFEKEKLQEAVRLSLTKYCGVNAMVSKVVPIRYRLYSNGQNFFEGAADFSELL
jgi:putative redox protein